MTTSRRSRVFLPMLLLAAAASLASPAAGEETHHAPRPASSPTESAPKRLGAVDGWSAYVYKEKSGRVCYLFGEAQKAEPAGIKRKAPTAMVTHRPEEKINNVVSFTEGYPLRKGSNVTVDVGGSKFDLFTRDDSAWASTADLDKSIVDALTKGKEAVVKGVPEKGPSTTDTYSLAGFPKALALIDKECGIKR
jgi:hypothetical protein